MAQAPRRASHRPAGGPQCERLWTVREVSEFLAIPVATLHQWRYLGTGPAAFRVGKLHSFLQFAPIIEQADQTTRIAPE